MKKAETQMLRGKRNISWGGGGGGEETGVFGYVTLGRIPRVQKYQKNMGTVDFLSISMSGSYIKKYKIFVKK